MDRLADALCFSTRPVERSTIGTLWCEFSVLRALVGIGRSPLGDGWVFKAMMACLIHIFMANVFLLVLCNFFFIWHVCLMIFYSLFV